MLNDKALLSSLAQHRAMTNILLRYALYFATLAAWIFATIFSARLSKLGALVTSKVVKSAPS